MDFINSLIDNYNIPILTAFLLGVLTSISPCPLATNITAIAYISKEIKTAKHTLLNGIFYTFGRGASYTILAILIYFGLSSFQVSSIFQGWGDKVLGPILIIIGLIMFGIIKVKIRKNKNLAGAKRIYRFFPFGHAFRFGVLSLQRSFIFRRAYSLGFKIRRGLNLAADFRSWDRTAGDYIFFHYRFCGAKTWSGFSNYAKN